MTTTASGVGNAQATPPTDAPSNASLVGATVEKPLHAALGRLLADEITLDALTPALQGFYLAGHRDALTSVLPELTRAEERAEQARSDADRLYTLLYTPRSPVHIGQSYAEIQRIRAETYGGKR